MTVQLTNDKINYEYDDNGNIAEKRRCNLTDGEIGENYLPYVYKYSEGSWKDQLVSYVGQTIEYDALGNPTNYRGKTMQWLGRKLMKANGVEMEYDYNGLRLRKGYRKYYWQGNTLKAEICGSNYIYYYYDESGVSGMNYNGKEYYYRKNVFGDIIAIYDTSGNRICQYYYNAFGEYKILGDSTIGELNPFRYRGYYYDTEFGLYYLQSRYYDPEVGRFISADDVSYLNPQSIFGLNLYAYCNNNPVMNVDPTGTWNWGKFWTITGIVVGTALFTVSIIASAGTVGALAGVGAAALGLSASAASAISTAATIGTYIVATGVAVFGLSDALEVANDGYNPIRDDIMGGSQSAYNITHGIFDGLGTVAVLAGTFGPKILQKVAQSGIPTREGFSRTFEINGNWSARVDATVHGNPKWHHNPHVHLLQRSVEQGGRVLSVYYFWEVIRSYIWL